VANVIHLFAHTVTHIKRLNLTQLDQMDMLNFTN